MTADYMFIHPSSALQAVAPNAVSSAASMWSSSCFSAGAKMGFAYPVTNAPTGNYTSVTVYYKTGFNPLNTSSCGQFPGAGNPPGVSIDVYEKAQNQTGQVFQCSSFGFDQIVAHEMGHFYHLADVYTAGCTDIMAQLDGTQHFVSFGDCTQADNQNTPVDENYPVDPSCQQPCYGTCSGGNCPAQNQGSPILISMNAGDTFALSGLEDPVVFDLDHNGTAEKTGWTARGGKTGILCLDLNGNGTIDDGGELFGNFTRLPDGHVASNGFQALLQYDEFSSGGNGDGVISSSDAIFPFLRVWLDANHDGVSQPGELFSLDTLAIASIDTVYALSEREDQYGNRFRYRGRYYRRANNPLVLVPHQTYDVFFVRETVPQ
jgi:hypothetical protein